MKKAVIFDMDGVIIQSENLYQKRRELFFEMHHLEVDDAFHEQIIGSNPKEMFRMLFPDDTKKQHDFLSEFNLFKKSFSINYEDILSDHIFIVLTWLKDNNYKIGLASSGEYLSLVHILETTGLEPYFDVVVSGDDMDESKPSPDVYLEALNQLNLQASECLAIEDSVYGIQAATSAGIECLALKPKHQKINQQLATKIILSLKEIPLWLS